MFQRVEGQEPLVFSVPLAENRVLANVAVATHDGAHCHSAPEHVGEAGGGRPLRAIQILQVIGRAIELDGPVAVRARSRYHSNLAEDAGVEASAPRARVRCISRGNALRILEEVLDDRSWERRGPGL